MALSFFTHQYSYGASLSKKAIKIGININGLRKQGAYKWTKAVLKSYLLNSVLSMAKSYFLWFCHGLTNLLSKLPHLPPPSHIVPRRKPQGYITPSRCLILFTTSSSPPYPACGPSRPSTRVSPMVLWFSGPKEWLNICIIQQNSLFLQKIRGSWANWNTPWESRPSPR